MRTIAPLARAIAITAPLTLAACASLAPPLAPPEVVGARVEVVAASVPEMRFAIGLALLNPNPEPLALADLEAALRVDGDTVLVSRLAAPVTLAAGAETRVSLDARADVAAAIVLAGRAMAAGRTSLHYELAGAVVLADGRRYPFRREGTTDGPAGGTAP